MLSVIINIPSMKQRHGHKERYYSSKNDVRKLECINCGQETTCSVDAKRRF